MGSGNLFTGNKFSKIEADRLLVLSRINFFNIVLRLGYICNLYSGRDYKTCICCWADLNPLLGLGCVSSLQGSAGGVSAVA